MMADKDNDSEHDKKVIINDKKKMIMIRLEVILMHTATVIK